MVCLKLTSGCSLGIVGLGSYLAVAVVAFVDSLISEQEYLHYFLVARIVVVACFVVAYSVVVVAYFVVACFGDLVMATVTWYYDLFAVLDEKRIDCQKGMNLSASFDCQRKVSLAIDKRVIVVVVAY